MYRAQQKKGRDLSYKEAVVAIQMSGRCCLPSGQTIDNMISELYDCKLVSISSIHVENPAV